MTHVHHVPVMSTPTAHKLDAALWGLFFLWAGIVLVAGLGWGVGLLGVGLITLGGQAARRYLGLALEGFWLLVGVFFLLGGVWELLGLRFAVVPVLLIAIGITLLASALRRSGD